MLNRVLLSIILFVFIATVPAFAKTETFGIATFKAPIGWEKGTKQGMVNFFKISDNGTRLLEGA